MVAEYLVQSLKDNLDDLEDRYNHLNREYKRNYRECDLLQRNHERIKKEYQVLHQSVQTKCELIEKNGLTISNHFDPIKLNNELSSDKFYINKDSTYLINNSSSTKQLNEIKVNGYHKDLNNSLNSVNNCVNNLNNHVSKPNKLNGQLDHLSSDGYIGEQQLTNGFIKSNGLNSSINSIKSPYSNNNCLNTEKRYTDQSSCSSLSSTNDKISCSSASLIFSEELYQFLTYVEGKTLNDKINYLLHDKINKMQRIKALRSNLDDEKIKSIKLESLSLINGKHLNGDLHKRFNQSKF